MIGPDGYGNGGGGGGGCSGAMCLVGGVNGVCGVNGSELTSKCICMRQIIWFLCKEVEER